MKDSSEPLEALWSASQKKPEHAGAFRHNLKIRKTSFLDTHVPIRRVGRNIAYDAANDVHAVLSSADPYVSVVPRLAPRNRYINDRDNLAQKTVNGVNGYFVARAKDWASVGECCDAVSLK